MDALIWIDWVIIAIVAISTLISLKRGFVREAMSLVIWVGAFVIARTFHPNMQMLLADTVGNPTVRLIAAFGILFVGTLVVGAVVNNALGRLVEATGLSATDRTLGMFFGLARGLVVVLVALALLRMTPVTGDTWWRESATVQELAKVEAWTRDVLGDEIDALLPDAEATSAASGEAMQEGAKRLIEMQEDRSQSPATAE
ncbi:MULTISPECIES: CvpA family protein [Gammaproteobacteria]|jgi:membrane protein required for colicin V production|uniref:Colicin V production CvpA n=2 Tax=Halomonadaceae TaxID=28256 RepID=A0A2A2F8G6_9GAMM|nr:MULTISPECIES: CvpA family protein [Gammaproteobacteria]KAA8984594.1 CvpA family protein [Halospina sp. K52047b]MYL27524.1 CvpA family protein [Halomonas utahensis]MYL74650.1 CvpA family protein [Halomonas sp. 22501_18_FS]PAU81014.1 colicin V production CvpA [Halovibrio salipaludis]